jgi:two-component system NtrC family sensor kinase
VVSFTPLLALGGVLYLQFAGMYRQKVEEQIRYRANAQAESVDLFLKERTAILSALADTHRYEDLLQEQKLTQLLAVMNTRAGAFVDIGVIDSKGNHRAYVGPYNLKGLNYYDQEWFGQVMSKGIYISDVYMGFRRIPHFIIAVRHQENEGSWIIRATIDKDILRDIVASAKVGKTGDAYIINREGIYQTRPRFKGEVLWESQIDTTMFGGRINVIEHPTPDGRILLMAGTWLKNKDWLLIISQDSEEEMKGLMVTRNLQISIIGFGVLIIILATIFMSTYMVKQLESASTKMDELNAQLMQSDKLAALGKMAAGIAHEINNPIAVIGEKAGWMRDLLSDEEFQQSENLAEYRKSIEKIEEHAERIRKIIHNMLGFARRMEPHLDEIDVNVVVNQTLELLQNHARINNIEIDRNLQTDLPVIASDQSQLQQVFLNLINNAIDAIGKDGKIEIVSRKTDSFIEIDIKDNGPGIPKSQQKRIFDPFFTTKQSGKGTGLGLSISYNIIEKLGGKIDFVSHEGKGTTFTVKLPIRIPEKR